MLKKKVEKGGMNLQRPYKVSTNLGIDSYQVLTYKNVKWERR